MSIARQHGDYGLGTHYVHTYLVLVWEMVRWGLITYYSTAVAFADLISQSSAAIQSVLCA